MANLGSNFYTKLADIAKGAGMPPEYILNVMALESGLDPSAGAGSTGAAGLVQIMPQYLKNYGYEGSAKDFRSESGETQLIYIEKLIKTLVGYNGGKSFKSAAQYYAANFLPASLKLPGVQNEDPNTIIVAENPDKPHLPNIGIQTEAKFYKANKGLDLDKDGVITYGDLQNKLKQVAGRSVYQNAVKALKEQTNYTPNKEESSDKTHELATNLLKNKNTGFMANLHDLLDKFLKMIKMSAQENKELYKAYLPSQDMLIHVKAQDPVDALEFSRVLCCAIEEELVAKAYTHTDGKNVEIECQVTGPKPYSEKAVQQLIDAISETFKESTKSIGGINIDTMLFINKKSSYKPISGKYAELNYRKFLFKLS